jgi:radical SAM superfamily enzyme YgiQ (UPF0313 family)
LRNKKLGYLAFGRDDFSYGLALCLSRMEGWEKFRVTPKTAKYVDVLLLSCFWWEHIYLVADFMRKAGISKLDKDRPLIVIGGFNTFNPFPFLAYADAVVCGDGETVINEAVKGDFASDYILTDGKTSGSWCSNPILTGFAHDTNGICRLEIARGCKAKCKFCAVSHLKPYREVPLNEVEKALKTTKAKRVAMFSPEPTFHTDNNALQELCRKYGKTRLDTDVRLDRIQHRHMDGGVLRSGIEGLSERLRKSVRKPYKNEFIIESVRSALAQGRTGMFFYLILDLPGEQECDFAEFVEMLHGIEKIPGCEKLVLVPSPSVFMPSPHTPMEYDKINWDRDYGEKWYRLFRAHGLKDGVNKPWKFQMAERARVFGPAARVLSMVSTRSGNEFFEVENALTRNKLISINKDGRVSCKKIDGLLKVLEPFGGVDKYCGEYAPETAPWKKVRVSASLKAADGNSAEGLATSA